VLSSACRASFLRAPDNYCVGATLSLQQSGYVVTLLDVPADMKPTLGV
jgi:hypothetical protein